MDEYTELAFSTAERLDDWVTVLAGHIKPLKQVTDEDGGSRFEFAESTPHAFLVGKLVRAVSGLRAAMLLANKGYCAESATILRTVSDFCVETMAVVEAMDSGSPTSAIQKIVAQYFEPSVRTPAELAERGKQGYVPRRDLHGSIRRMMEKAGLKSDRVIEARRFLDNMFDGFVHGAAGTSAELYRPQTHSFMLRGQRRAAVVQDYVEAVAGNVHSVIVAVAMTAKVFGESAVANDALGALRALDDIARAERS